MKMPRKHTKDKHERLAHSRHAPIHAKKREHGHERLAHSRHAPMHGKQTRRETLKQKLRDLELIDNNLLNRVSTLEHKTEVAEKALRGLTRLAKAAEDMTVVLGTIENRTVTTYKNLGKVESGIVGIGQHAKDIEAAHHDVKFAAQELSGKTKELSEMSKHFMRQLELLNNKLNANISALSDLSIAVEALKNRLFSLEKQQVDVAQISALLERNSEVLELFAKRLSFLEKVTAKTIVLD